MNKKTITLVTLTVLATSAFAQQETIQETFLQPQKVVIESNSDSMSIIIEGRKNEPDFEYSRTIYLAQDEVVVTRERRTAAIEFNIPFMNKPTPMDKSNRDNRRPHSEPPRAVSAWVLWMHWIPLKE